MHSPLSVPALARLLLKTHTEFASLFDRPQLGVPAPALPPFILQLGGARLALEAAAGLTLNCSQGPLDYHLQVDPFEAGKAPAMSARLTDRRTGHVHELDGAAVFKGDIPPAFQALHAEVTSHLRAFVPPALWQHLIAAGAATPPSGDSSGAANAADTAASAPDAGAAESAQDAAVQEGAADALRTYVLARRGEADLRFTGKLLDAVASLPLNGRWTEYLVYQTRAGKYIGVKLGRSMRLGESDRVESQVAEELVELAEFFGHNPLAKMLTHRLGIRQYEEVA